MYFSMKKYAIIVAGGSGSRMKSQLPKQFLLLNGVPILMHTLLRFKQADAQIELILVLPQAHQAYWQSLCAEHAAIAEQIPHRLVNGGASRFESSKNGLSVIDDAQALVAIHDGVRPFADANTINQSFETALAVGSAVVSVPSKDSIRVQGKAVDRASVRLIQTPQTFQLSVLRQAFETDELPIFTDDASVVEHAGFAIHLIDGSYENIKITTPEDLWIAEVLDKRYFQQT